MITAKVKHKSNTKSVKQILEWMQSRRVYVGIPRGEEASRGDGGITNAELAIIHEFGTSRIPARPWIKPPLRAKQREFSERLGKVFTKCKFGKEDPEPLYDQIGMLGAAAVKNYVTRGAGVPPPNAPSTIARKGSSRPLIDTGSMVGAVTWEIREKKK